MDKEQVKKELESVVSSNILCSKKQLCKFLSYIVTEELEERGKQLSQYDIAVYGLGKSKEFSSKNSPLVRVEAGRLRKLLDTYYDQNKASDIIISLPKLSYRPIFIQNDTISRSKKTAPNKLYKAKSDAIKVMLNCQIHASTQKNTDLPPRIMLDFLLTLNKFSLSKILLASSDSFSACNPLKGFKGSYQADFLLKMDIEPIGQSLSFKFLLVHTSTEEVVWGDSFFFENFNEYQLIKATYTKIANNLLSPDNGVVHHYYAQYLQGKKNSSENQLALLHLNNAYRSPSHGELEMALKFCEQRLVDYPHDSISILVNLHLYIQAFLSGYPVTTDLQDCYTRLVNTALRIEPKNADIRLFHAFSAYLQEDFELSRQELQHALSINPHASFNQIFAGGLYYMLGDFDVGDLCINAAINANSSYPDWYCVLTSLRAYRQNDFQKALLEAKKIYMPWGCLFRALIYWKSDEKDLALLELAKGNVSEYTLITNGRCWRSDVLHYNPFLKMLMADINSLLAKANSATKPVVLFPPMASSPSAGADSPAFSFS